MVKWMCDKGARATCLYLWTLFLRGGSVMSTKLNVALDYLAKAAAVLTVIAEAGRRVISLCNGE